jgi:hypothetical protein
MAAQQKQFDFWVGEWEASWPGQNGSPSGHGTNSIMRILDGCVVQEYFSGQGTPPFHGTSLSIYDLKPGKWKQTWSDNQGAYLDFVRRVQGRPDDPAARVRDPMAKHFCNAWFGKTLPRMNSTGVGKRRMTEARAAGAVAHPLQAQELMRR